MIHVLTRGQFRALNEARERYRIRAFGERKRREQVEADREFLRQRIRELEEIVVTMKREGFEPAPQPPEMEGTMIHSAVLEALEEVAPPGMPYRGRELALAMADLEAGVEPGEVARRMREGGKVNIWSAGRLREDVDG